MNCAWCNPSNNGTDGICDNCMRVHFGIDPATIHAEIDSEKKTAVPAETSTKELEVVNA